MKRVFFLLLLTPILFSLTGCGATDNTADAGKYNSTDANGQPVSTIPWNKQQDWEGQGQLGTALGH